LIVSFGTNYATEYYNDVWLLPLTSGDQLSSWIDVSSGPQTVKPKPRAFAASASLMGGLIIFGGVGQGDPNVVPDFFVRVNKHCRSFFS
jgi:hypothetical protein